jgi:hypothetical protein
MAMNEQQASGILDFQAPLDVDLFDNVVAQFYQGNMALQKVNI